MSVGRWVRHWFKTPYAVRRTFDEQALERIAQAIAASEATHGGEIRFAVEPALPWSYLKRDAPARERAAMVFSKLRVWDTEQNNGVLIYVELADHSIEIVADPLHDLVGDDRTRNVVSEEQEDENAEQAERRTHRNGKSRYGVEV